MFIRKHMSQKIVLFIITIIVVIAIYYVYSLRNTNNKNDNKNQYIHDNSEYPQMKFVFDNRRIIQEEFFKYVKNNCNWTNWMEYNKVTNTPIFTKMTNDQILKRMIENKCCLDDYISNTSGNPSWKLFGLFLYGKPIETNVNICPQTVNILRQCDGVVNAGFSCLEPGVITELHRDFNHDVLRCHIPIYVPHGDTAIQINEEIKRWNDNEYFIFDDTYDHQAWNYTKENRIVLIIDIVKNK